MTILWHPQHIYLCDEDENWQLFVSFVLPSSGIILTIYYTLYGLCKIRPLDGSTHATTNNTIFGLNFALLSRHIYSTLYVFYTYRYVDYVCRKCFYWRQWQYNNFRNFYNFFNEHSLLKQIPHKLWFVKSVP